jgi:hypothetical protein
MHHFGVANMLTLLSRSGGAITRAHSTHRSVAYRSILYHSERDSGRLFPASPTSILCSTANYRQSTGHSDQAPPASPQSGRLREVSHWGWGHCSRSDSFDGRSSFERMGFGPNQEMSSHRSYRRYRWPFRQPQEPTTTIRATVVLIPRLRHIASLL